MGEEPCMDITCLGVLVSKTRDVISKAAVVSVDVVQVDGLRGRAFGECPENGHGGATRLKDDERSETRSGHGRALHIPKIAVGCGARWA